MKKSLFILLITLAAQHSFCQNQEYQKSTAGIEYKIISNGSKDSIKVGNFLEMHFTNLLSHNGKDSVMANTREAGGSQIMQLDSLAIPAAYYAIFSKMKVGDSLHSRTIVDSIFNKSPEQMPPYMQWGDYVYTNISIVNVFKTKDEADLVIKKNQAEAQKMATAQIKIQATKDDAILSEFIKKNNIKATKTAKGVYVSTLQAGIGANLNNQQFAKVLYKGKTLSGTIFDTNMDNSKGHTDPLVVNLTNDRSLGNGVIEGMTEALLTMQKGTKATMYIPSGLAYGTRGAGGDITPNANLIFEVEILATQSVAAFKAEQAKLAAKENVKVAPKEVKKSAVIKKTTPTKKAIIKPKAKVPVKK